MIRSLPFPVRRLDSPRVRSCKLRWTLGWSPFVLVAILASGAIAARGLAQTGSPPASSPPSTPASDANDPTLIEARRTARAAVELVARSDEGAQAVARALRSPSTREARMVLLRELARSTAPDHPYVTLALGDLLSVDDPALTIESLRALGAAHSREAVGYVMGLLQGDRGPIIGEIRTQALLTLERQTGKDELGNDPAAWGTWWQTAQFLPEAQWRSEMARDHARRADRLQHDYDHMVEQMVDLQRRLYLLSSEDERPRILATLISSQIAPLKMLGLELTERRLLNARPIDQTISATLVQALGEPDPEIRADAASLLARLGSDDGAQTLLGALLRETHPIPAAALLRATGRQPQPALLSPALKWLEAGGEARVAAIETLVAVMDLGVELSPAQAARAGSAIASNPGAPLSEGEMALLLELGQTPAVVARLRARDPAQATAAARVLAESGVAIDALVRAAQDVRALSTSALNALARHRTDRGGVELAALIADPSNPTHRARVLTMARALAPATLLEVARSQGDPRLREMLLQPAGEAAFFVTRRQPVAQIESAITLARLRIDLGDQAGARAGLTQLPNAWRGPRVDALDIELALLDARFDEAATRTISSALSVGRAGVVLEPWLRTLPSPPPVDAIDALQRVLASLADILSMPDLDALERLVGDTQSASPTPTSPSTQDQPTPRVDAEPTEPGDGER